MSMDLTGEKPQRLLPQTLETLFASWMRRAAGALVVAAVGFTWLALLTWSAQDPSLSHSTSEAPRNILGMPGALLSDLLLQMMGLASVFLLIPTVIGALQMVIDDRIERFRTRLFLLAIAVPALAAGLSALPPSARWLLPYGYGGVLGDALFDLTAAVFAIFLPQGGSVAAGLSFFILGSWALVRSIGLDRRELFEMLWQAGSLSSRSAAFCLPTASSVSATAESLLGFRKAPAAAEPQRPSEPSFRDERAEPRLHPIPAPRSPVVAHVEADVRPMQPATHEEHVLEPYDDTYTDDTIEVGAIARRFAPRNAPLPPRGDDTPAPSVGRGGFGHAEPRWGDPAAGPVSSEPDLGLTFASLPGARVPSRPPVSGPVAWPGPSPAERSAAAGDSYRRPSLNLLSQPPVVRNTEESEAHLLGQAKLLEAVLADFRIQGEVKDIRPGPVVTLFEFEPARGIKSSRVIALADDIARSMSAASARIAVISGRNVIGIELPNSRRERVALRDLIESPAFRTSEAKLPLTLGKSIAGDPVVADLARMPHLLVAGTTGSGKSVGINAMILSLLYRLPPEECRMIMIDPKMLELSVYNDIPHLLTPVVTEPDRALAALNWTVGEMEERYKRMAELGVRNIEIFNNRARHAMKQGEILGQTVQTGYDAATGEPIYEQRKVDLEPMPYIVVVVDEFADLMSVAGKDVEVAIQRLAQKARAAGIHLIMATQRPSVDVVTGTIKANFPTRISFKVASRIDSRTILNEQGAEQLLGQGDMLFADGGGNMQRLHGPFVSDDEVQAVSQVLREHRRPNYVDGIAELPEPDSSDAGRGSPSDADLYHDAVEMILRDGRASTSYLQRRFSIGYNRAANLLERMEDEGIVSGPDRAGRRQVLGGEDPGLLH